MDLAPRARTGKALAPGSVCQKQFDSCSSQAACSANRGTSSQSTNGLSPPELTQVRDLQRHLGCCRTRGSNAAGRSSSSNAQGNSGSWSSNSVPLCPSHGLECLSLTSNTAGNPGRKFFKCPHPTEAKNCLEFVWADEYEGGSAGVLYWFVVPTWLSPIGHNTFVWSCTVKQHTHKLRAAKLCGVVQLVGPTSCSSMWHQAVFL